MPGKSTYFTTSRNEVIGLVFRLTLFGALTYFGIKWIVNTIDPTRKQKIEAQKRAEKIFAKIGIKDLKLSEYELSIAAQLVDPASLSVSWNHIAGLDTVIQEIKETVILPIQKRELFVGSQLIQPPKGVLLHGPPGCGKTMIAKATAKEAGARFINLEVSALTDKWYGESEKLAASVFTLAMKIQPCIIFIDEIDSFLRARDRRDHEATAMMKALFMSLWDGLITDPSCQVLIMGATNRPEDVDKAILRRMPAMFHIGLPSAEQRKRILLLILENEIVSDDIDSDLIGNETVGFSGSDLRELCRNAALYRVRDYLRDENLEDGRNEEDAYHDALRPICLDDFLRALCKMRESKMFTFGLEQL